MMRWIAAVALATALVVGDAAAQGSGAIRPRTAYEDLQMFSQVLNQIRVNHPDSVDTHRLFMAAITGMVGAADPHSFVIPAARLSPEKERAFREGRLFPVPIAFQYIGGSPVVRSVAPGSSASSQDVLRGDVLVRIDGALVAAESAGELEVYLAGPRNSTVTLTFERQRSDGSTVDLERTVRRERIDEASTVPVATMLDRETGYVRVTEFGAKTTGDLRAALESLERAGMERLVLDLRDNGGGRVDEAARVAGLFLPAGSTVYTSRGRKPEVNDSVAVRRSFWRRERQYPIVALVNDGTASSAELVAGALQDHDRALIVGRPTFGKALIQQGFPLADGSVLVLVIGHLRTPCGRVIQREYREIRATDYYRLARADREVAGRATCTTRQGRTVYGGGGIFPDVVLDEAAPLPTWLSRLVEDHVLVRWAGAYADDALAQGTMLDAWSSEPAAGAAMLEHFRDFAAAAGVSLPDSETSDTLLTRRLRAEVAVTRWGTEGWFRHAIADDPQIAEARRQLTTAAGLRGPAG
jgi:carboxyl-terminal processing protease